MKATPKFTWYRWGVGAEKWGTDDRARCASMLKAWRKDKRFKVEILGRNFYRVSRDEITALVRTR